MNARATAAQILDQVLQHGRSLTLALTMLPLPAPDAGLIKEFCYGTLRWYFQLDTQAKHFLKKPLKAKDTDIYALILIGIYQLTHMRVPPHAAVGETVNAARTLGKPWAAGLLNGILRSFQRSQAALTKDLELSPVSLYAHPKWFVTQIQSAWPKQWQHILNANNQHPPLTLRCNQLQITRDAYLQQLAQQNILALPTPYAAQGISLVKPLDPTQLPGFNQGVVSVQDAAAQFAATLLELQPGQRVLDACAAPGGKATHILEAEPQIATLIALDQDSERISKVQENLQRSQLSAQVIVGDASQPDAWWDQQLFDRILIDAPCSATGVIRRHPDIKLLRRDSDINDLIKLQSKILIALWPLLKPGGVMVYATCSILPQENHLQLEHFLKNHPDAKEKPIEAAWGHPVSVGRQILPGEDNMDGFFYARLAKSI